MISGFVTKYRTESLLVFIWKHWLANIFTNTYFPGCKLKFEAVSKTLSYYIFLNIWYHRLYSRQISVLFSTMDRSVCLGLDFSGRYRYWYVTLITIKVGSLYFSLKVKSSTKHCKVFELMYQIVILIIRVNTLYERSTLFSISAI